MEDNKKMEVSPIKQIEGQIDKLMKCLRELKDTLNDGEYKHMANYIYSVIETINTNFVTVETKLKKQNPIVRKSLGKGHQETRLGEDIAIPADAKPDTVRKAKDIMKNMDGSPSIKLVEEGITLNKKELISFLSEKIEKNKKITRNIMVKNKNKPNKNVKK
jgi:flagellin-specific chaperone FliS